MAARHDSLVSRYRATLVRKGFNPQKDPFHEYKPDIYAVKASQEVIVEVEICSTFDSSHTMHQVSFMYHYASIKRTRRGILVVPRSCIKKAQFMIFSMYGMTRCITVVGL